MSRRVSWLALVVLVALLGPGPASGAPADPPPVAAGRALPHMLHGVTAESVGRLDALVRALRSHRVTPAVRVVFQPGRAPSRYHTAVRRLRRAAWLVGLPFDSTAVRAASLAEYRRRTQRYVDRFGSRVDLWEIGNELNGAWLGRPRTIDAKVAAAFDVVERGHAAQHLRSAITLNYWPSHNCYAKPWEATLPFARQLPARVRRGVDVVLLSFYETACSPRARPSVRRFAAEFIRLGRIFPHARLGLGEIGAQGRADGQAHNPTLAEKKRIATRYYGMQARLRGLVGRRYLGGGFWWYYVQDAVRPSASASLWPTLDRLLATF